MPYAELHYSWTWELAATPEALWPLVSNTDRFNRDCGFPSIEIVKPSDLPAEALAEAGTRRIRAKIMGLVIEWDERPFEWIAPQKFGVERTYHSGPLAQMRVLCELTPRAGGATLTYQMWLTPASLLGRLAVPVQIGRQSRATFDRVFRHYDALARQGIAVSDLAQRPQLAPGAIDRLAAIREKLIASGQPADLIDRLLGHVTKTDDLSVTRIRPYALADLWQADRRAVLQLFLHATRAGLLDFSWDVLCPMCRGASALNRTLSTLSSQMHCDSCQIDYTANFDQSVELTFSPNAAIRPAPRPNYCAGGPQVTPHIVAQQRLAPAESRTLPLSLQPGRYRLRSPQSGSKHIVFRVEPRGTVRTSMILDSRQNMGVLSAEALAKADDLDAPSPSDLILAPASQLELCNPADTPRLVILEHLAWTDQAATAAEVAALQLFRDLFANEVLRPGEQISVGSMTIVFTDLKGSTQMYRDIGDAPAFGRVLTHFEILKAAVAAEGGAIVKTMGDAIMAVFPRPVAAVRAILAAQRQLAHPAAEISNLKSQIPDSRPLPAPLALKAGIHRGPCIAINQNERLDYFGSTVNLAARLCSLCTGADVVLAASVAGDAEVAAHLADQAHSLRSQGEHLMLRGFGGETFEIRRVTAGRTLTP